MNKGKLFLSKKKRIQLFFILLIGLFIFLLLIINRPDYLSFGTIAFVFGCVFVFISGVFFLYCVKYRHDVTNIFLLDILYGAVVSITIISFIFFAKQSQMVHRAYTVFSVFILYLLIRISFKQYVSNKRDFLVSFFVVIAGIEAFRGIIQFLSHSQMKGFFFNVNYFGMYIALNVPLALVLLWRKEKKLPNQVLFSFILGLMGVSVLLSRCRTAYAGLIVTILLMLFIRYHHSLKQIYLRSSRYILFLWGSASVVILSLLAALFIFLKPLSTVGRFFIWKVSWRMFSDFPILGVGHGNFSSLYNLYQGRFFAQGLGTELERMSASPIPYAFNEYIESAVEFGMFGFVLFAVFWFFVIKSVWRAFRREDNLTFGMAGLVLLSLTMSFFYNPSHILPIYLIFSVCLACVVSVQKLRIRFKLPLKSMAVFSLLSFLVSIVFLPTFYKQFKAEQTWHRARILSEEGQDNNALEKYDRVYPSLKWDGNFMHQYGKILLKTGDTKRAIQYLEQGKEFWPDPYLLEDLAVAYERNDNLEQAIKNASVASSILPWRLTSKSLLTDFYYKKGDIINSAKYARILLETPMKIWTREGENIKEKARIHIKKIEDSFESPQTPTEKAMALLPQEYRMQVMDALVRSGANAGELMKAILELDSEKRVALAFLLANMPGKDLKSLTADFLISNVKYAFKARQALPYNRNVPEDVFLNYVLPYVNAIERRDNWRADFYDRFIDTALKNHTVEETAVDLNAKIYQGFNLEFTEIDFHKIIYSPYESIKKNIVSCAEASLMFVNACRAVGIPARMVFLPRWIHFKGGHVWLEVYDNGQWHYINSYDPSRFDDTWFALHASKTDMSRPEHRIYASSFRRTGIHVLYGPDVSFIDVTDRYVSKEKSQ